MSIVALVLAIAAAVGLAFESTRGVGLLAAVALTALFPAVATAIAVLLAGLSAFIKYRSNLHAFPRLSALGD